MSGYRQLVVIDFDETILAVDSFQPLSVLLPPDLAVEKPVNADQLGSINYKNEVLRRLAALGFTAHQLRDIIRNTPAVPGMIEFLRYLFNVTNPKIDVIVISDTNDMFINDWMVHNKFNECFEGLFANPMYEVAAGGLVIRPYHNNIYCSFCPPNFCKRRILEQFLSKQQDSGICYERIIYIGDGKNDFCPILILRKNDIVCARSGFGLDRFIEDYCKQNTLRPCLIRWDFGNDLLNKIKPIIAYSYNQPQPGINQRFSTETTQSMPMRNINYGADMGRDRHSSTIMGNNQLQPYCKCHSNSNSCHNALKRWISKLIKAQNTKNGIGDAFPTQSITSSSTAATNYDCQTTDQWQIVDEPKGLPNLRINGQNCALCANKTFQNQVQTKSNNFNNQLPFQGGTNSSSSSNYQHARISPTKLTDCYEKYLNDNPPFFNYKPSSNPDNPGPLNYSNGETDPFNGNNQPINSSRFGVCNQCNNNNPCSHCTQYRISNQYSNSNLGRIINQYNNSNSCSNSIPYRISNQSSMNNPYRFSNQGNNSNGIQYRIGNESNSTNSCSNCKQCNSINQFNMSNQLNNTNQMNNTDQMNSNDQIKDPFNNGGQSYNSNEPSNSKQSLDNTSNTGKRGNGSMQSRKSDNGNQLNNRKQSKDNSNNTGKRANGSMQSRRSDQPIYANIDSKTTVLDMPSTLKDNKQCTAACSDNAQTSTEDVPQIEQSQPSYFIQQYTDPDLDVLVDLYKDLWQLQRGNNTTMQPRCNKKCVKKP